MGDVVVVTIATLTEPERDQMAHAIGHASAKGCSVHGGRNHYVTSADDPLWTSLAERKLARVRPSSILPEGEVYFIVTDDGRAAVESDPRSAPPVPVGRAYTVLFKGAPDCPIHVRGVTPGKARYAAVRRVMDADWYYTAAEGFGQIASCRLSS